MRIIRLQDGKDLNLLMQLRAQRSRMLRDSLDARRQLIGEQEMRRKRESSYAGANAAEWTRHIVATEMLNVASIDAEAALERDDEEDEVPENENNHRYHDDETMMEQPYDDAPQPLYQLPDVSGLPPIKAVKTLLEAGYHAAGYSTAENLDISSPPTPRANQTRIPARPTEGRQLRLGTSKRASPSR